MKARSRAENGTARCTLSDIDPDVVVRSVALALAVHSRMSAEARKDLPAGTPPLLPCFDEELSATPLLSDPDAAYFTAPENAADAVDARPLADALERFVREVYECICTEPEVPIVALVLVERLVRVVGVGFIRRQSVRPIVASAFVLACKIWFDDLTHIVDFCQIVCAGDRTWLKQLAACELELLSRTGFDVTVRPRTFAVYYFAMLASLRQDRAVLLEEAETSGLPPGPPGHSGALPPGQPGALGAGGGVTSAKGSVSGCCNYTVPPPGRARAVHALGSGSSPGVAQSGQWEYASATLPLSLQRASRAEQLTLQRLATEAAEAAAEGDEAAEDEDETSMAALSMAAASAPPELRARPVAVGGVLPLPPQRPPLAGPGGLALPRPRGSAPPTLPGLPGLGGLAGESGPALLLGGAQALGDLVALSGGKAQQRGGARAQAAALRSASSDWAANPTLRHLTAKHSKLGPPGAQSQPQLP